MVEEIYSLRETLTKNFEVNSTKVTESNERTNKQTNKQTNVQTNGKTERRKLYTPWHKCRGYKNVFATLINELLVNRSVACFLASAMSRHLIIHTLIPGYSFVLLSPSGNLVLNTGFRVFIKRRQETKMTASNHLLAASNDVLDI